jgi:hypothetical protein
MEMKLSLFGLNSATPLVAWCIMGQCLCHFTVALVKLRIPHFLPPHLPFHSSNQANFTWFSFGVTMETHG